MVKGTGIGTLLGTMPYMAPEQIEGRDVDARSDIFSLGAVIYEMVTGQRAFKGDSPASVIGAIMKDEPPPMTSLQPLTPAALDHVVTTCLAKDPDERWQSAADIARELKWIGPAGLDARHTRRSRRLDECVCQRSSARSRRRDSASTVRGAGRRPASAAAAGEVDPLRGGTAGRIQASSAVRSSISMLQFAMSPDGRNSSSSRRRAGGEPSLWLRALNDRGAASWPGTAAPNRSVLVAGQPSVGSSPAAG